MLVHLGMSGSLRLVVAGSDWRKHDHIEMQMDNGAVLRYHDPRRFGCWAVVGVRTQSVGQAGT